MCQLHSRFFRGNKGALGIPFLSFQYLRRPGCTAKLLCFQYIGGFEPHRLRELSLLFSMRYEDSRGALKGVKPRSADRRSTLSRQCDNRSRISLPLTRNFSKLGSASRVQRNPNDDRSRPRSCNAACLEESPPIHLGFAPHRTAGHVRTLTTSIPEDVRRKSLHGTHGLTR